MTFDDWYKHYPKKKGRGHALRAWKTLNPDDELIKKMIQSLEDQKKERAYKKSRGEWMPEWKYPATWIRAESWEDEIELPKVKEIPIHRKVEKEKGDFTDYIEAMKELSKGWKYE